MRWQMAAGTALLLGTAGVSYPVHAQDFLANLFGVFGGRPPASRPQMILPFAEGGGLPMEAPQPRLAYGGGQAWCVRTCDGRYFPVTGPDPESKAASCNSFCPASRTEIVYGNDIDHAATASGKSYTELPNAFKYRSEIVASCTCNGKDTVGLAPVSIDKDPTLRKGDIVAGASALLIANPGNGRHAELNFTPLPASVRARFHHLPVVAKE